MPYNPPIKGKIIKKTPIPTKTGKDYSDDLVKLIADASSSKTELIHAVDDKFKEIDSKIETVTQEITEKAEETIQAIEQTKEQAIEIIKEIQSEVKNGEDGEDGKDADEEYIVEEVLKRIPKLDTALLEEQILSKVPKIDEKSLTTKILKKIPENKASLKVIQEHIETDPMSVIEKIMALEEDDERLKKLRSRMTDGFEQTISAFRNQLARGYLHGGGLSTVSHDSTLTGDGTPSNPLSVVGGGGASTLQQTFTFLDFLDDGSGNGYANFTSSLPVNAVPIGVTFEVIIPFDTGVTLEVVDSLATNIDIGTPVTGDVVGLFTGLPWTGMSQFNFTATPNPVVFSAGIIPTQGSVTVTVVYVLNTGGGGGGAGNPSLPFNSIQYNNNGSFFGDINAIRDPITNETRIGQDDGFYTSQHVITDITGFGNWAAGITRDNNLGNGSSAIATVDGTVFGSPDASMVFINFDDSTVTISGGIRIDSTGTFFYHDDIATNTATLRLDANTGSFLGFNNANSGNTFSNAFFSATIGIGWTDVLGGATFLLPIVDGSNGDVLTTDGAGNLSFQAGGGGGLAIGNAVTGGTPKEVLYTDNSGNLFSDASFYRDSVTQEWGEISSGVQAGYTTMITADSNLITGILLSHVDPILVKGSVSIMRDTRSNMFWRDNSLSLLGGFDVDSVGGGTPSASMSWQDGATPTLTRARATGTDFRTEYTSSVATNETYLDATSFYIQSSIISPSDKYFKIDWTAQNISYGDLSNVVSGWGVGVDYSMAGRVFIAGDIGSTQNGTVFYANDVTQTSGFGDPSVTSNGTAILINDQTGTQVAASQGKVGGVLGFGLVLDYFGAAFAMGDVSGNWNGTLFFVDDTQQIISGKSNSNDSLFGVSVNPTDPAVFGWKAGQNVTTGSGNTLIGQVAGTAITDANDNTAIGAQALLVNTGGHSNTAVGSGALSALNDSGISNAEYNTALGRGAGLGVTTGSYNILLGYNTGTSVLTTGNYNILIGNSATVSSANSISRVAIGFTATATADYQVMFGGTGSPFSEFVIGSGDAVGIANSTDVKLRINNQSGTNEAGRNFKYYSGIGTGTGGSGEHQWFTAPAAASSSTLNTATKVLSLDLNGNLRAYTLHNNITAQGSATQQDIRSGTYTPSATNLTNLNSATPTQAQWLRVGNVVTVSGAIEVENTIAGIFSVRLSLPVNSAFGTNAAQVAGVATSIGFQPQFSMDANDTAKMTGTITPGFGVPITFYYTYTFEVV